MNVETRYQVGHGASLYCTGLKTLREARAVVGRLRRGQWTIERYNTKGSYWEVIEQGVK